MDQKILFEIKKFPQGAVFFTDRKKIPDFEKTIKALPKNSTIIIREYDLPKIERENFALRISTLGRSKGLKILVGKDFALARKIKANGVHFSDFDKLPIQFFKKKSFPKDFIFSISYHNFRKFRNTKTNLVFISPIFPSSSHVGARNLGLINLAKIASKTKNSKYFSSSLFALGGINCQNLKSLRKLKICGFGAIDLFKL